MVKLVWLSYWPTPCCVPAISWKDDVMMKSACRNIQLPTFRNVVPAMPWWPTAGFRVRVGFTVYGFGKILEKPTANPFSPAVFIAIRSAVNWIEK